MHFRNSCTRSMSSCAIRQVPSAASGARGLNFLIFFFTWKFQETSVIKSFRIGKALIGSIVIGFSRGKSLGRDMHMSFGIPFPSAEQEPHLPALHFPRHGGSVGCL